MRPTWRPCPTGARPTNLPSSATWPRRSPASGACPWRRGRRPPPAISSTSSAMPGALSMRKLIRTLAVPVALILSSAGTAWADAYQDALSAVALGHDGDLVELLDKGMDPNTVDASGNSLLILAARDSHLSTVDLLIKRGAKVGQRNFAGDSALMMAVLKGEVAKRLLAADAPVNQSGWTPLMYAAYSGRADMVALLLEKGADVNARAPNQSTSLMLAARNGHMDAVRLLLKAGAETDLKNDQGFTAESWANNAGNTDAADLIAAY